LPPQLQEPHQYPQRHAAGIFAELRDPAEQTLYQVDVSPQLGGTMEVFAPNAQPKQAEVPARKRVVTVIVPDAPAGSSVVVVRRHGTPAKQGRLAAEAARAEEELMRVSLSDDEVDE